MVGAEGYLYSSLWMMICPKRVLGPLGVSPHDVGNSWLLRGGQYRSFGPNCQRIILGGAFHPWKGEQRESLAYGE